MTNSRRFHRSLIALAITAVALVAIPASASAVPAIRNITVTPSSWDFGDLRVGTDPLLKTLTVTNAVTSNSPWTYTGASFSSPDGSMSLFNQTACMSQTLAVGQSCTVQVMFQPSSTGPKTASFTPLIGDATTVGTTTFTGNAIDPQASYSPDNTLDWGYVDFNATPTTLTETISNTGVGNLHITNLTKTGTDKTEYIVDSTDCGSVPFTIAEGASCDINVTLTPATATYKEAYLTIEEENGEIGGVTINLYGEAVSQSLHAIDSNWSFAPREVSSGPSSGAFITFENDSLITTSINSYSITGADASDFNFGSSDCGLSLTATTACTASVTFDPTSAGNKTANLHVVYDSPRGTLDIPLDGVGIADPAAPVSPTPPATPTISAAPIKPAALKKLTALEFNVGCGAAGCTLNASTQFTVKRKKGKKVKFTVKSIATATAGGTVKLMLKLSSSQAKKLKTAKSASAVTTISATGASPVTLKQSLK